MPSTQILIISAAHSGYRRAGLALDNGENLFDASSISDTQLAQLAADPRLVVAAAEADAPETNSSNDSQGVLVSSSTSGDLTFAAALAQLDPSNKDHFTGSGKPQVSALEGLMGKPLSAAERDTLWEEYQAANALNEQE